MENLTPENLDRFHDAIYDSTNIDLPKDSLVVAFNFLPTKIKNIADGAIKFTYLLKEKSMRLLPNIFMKLNIINIYLQVWLSILFLLQKKKYNTISRIFS